MDKRLKSFISKIFIFTFALIFISGVIFAFLAQKYFFTGFPYLFIIFVSVSILVHTILLKASKERPARFSRDFMISVMLKLFLYSAFTGLYIYLDKINLKPIVISVMTMYFLYTFFEIKILLSDLNKKE